MPDSPFPNIDTSKTYVLAGTLLKRILDTLARCAKLTAAPPLMLADTPAGKVLSIALPPGATLLRLTGTATGAGTYNARVQQVKSTGTTQASTTDLNLATWYQDLNSSDDAVYENLAENNQSGHALTTGANSFVIGWLTQRFASDLSNRPIYQGQPSTPQGLIPVNVAVHAGGTNGTTTTTANYTYDVTNALTGNAISGGPYSPVWARANGEVNTATHGDGYYNSSGTFILYRVDETPMDDTCS